MALFLQDNKLIKLYSYLNIDIHSNGRGVMKKKLSVGLVTGLVLCGMIGIANANILTFDDITMSTNRDKFVDLGIQNSYGGLQWPNISSSNGDGTAYWAAVNNSDSQFSTVGAYSGTQSAWNFNDGTSMSIIFLQLQMCKVPISTFLTLVKTGEPILFNLLAMMPAII
jgi:hypothetical protein